MNKLKISLAIVVLAALLYFIIKWKADPTQVNPPKTSYTTENPFVLRIGNEIKSLAALPNIQLCSDIYNKISFYIDDAFNNNNLGSTKLENDQWKDILSKDLYGAYVQKFISQAIGVFKGTIWELSTLNCIRSECKKLKSSSFLERGTPVDKKLDEIQAILLKHDEASQFISNYNSFPNTGFSLSDNFPIEIVSKIILKAKGYKSNNFYNLYVNNCSRLHVGIKNVEGELFKKHVKYLENKFDEWIGFYKEPSIPTFRKYKETIYDPLVIDLQQLSSDVYTSIDVTKEFDRLADKLYIDSKNAYNYFDAKN